jgi:hypothetical protein
MRLDFIKSKKNDEFVRLLFMIYKTLFNQTKKKRNFFYAFVIQKHKLIVYLLNKTNLFMAETNRIEYKRELNSELDIEKEVVAFFWLTKMVIQLRLLCVKL